MLLFTSLFQASFFRFGKASSFHSNQTVSKSKLINGIKEVDCINEIEEDSNEDSPENNLQSILNVGFELFNSKLNNLLLVCSNYNNFNRNLFNSVPIHIALGVFRI